MALPKSVPGRGTPAKKRVPPKKTPVAKKSASRPGNAAAKKKSSGAAGPVIQGSLNPPFDPRMRRVGSPLNNAGNIRRGWIQSGPNSGTRQRVNFLYNPSQLDIAATLNPDQVVSEAQAPKDDPTQMFQTGTGSTLSVALLYDRTYEMFSPNAAARTGLANQYGVYADVAAWFYFLRMLDTIPKTGKWARSLMSQPMNLVDAYLYIGPYMVYYGFVSAITVTYSHWSQHMIPIRCKVDISFSILPTAKVEGGPTSAPGTIPGRSGGTGWGSDPDLPERGSAVRGGSTRPFQGGGVQLPTAPGI